MFVKIRSQRVPLAFDLGGRAAASYEGAARSILGRALAVEELLHLHLASKVIVPDAAMLPSFPKSIRERTSVIPNAVDASVFAPLGQRADAQTVLYVGRLTVHRGLRIFMKALEILRQQALKCVIVGEGPLLPEVVEWGRRQPYPVHVTGEVPNSEMPELYNRATVVVNPMLLDGIGNITLEALSCGKCVIKSASGPRDPIIRDGEDGLLFRMGDPEDLAEKIAWALQHPKNRAEMGQAGRNVVLRGFTPEVEARAVLGVLEDLSAWT